MKLKTTKWYWSQLTEKNQTDFLANHLCIFVADDSNKEKANSDLKISSFRLAHAFI